MVFPQKTLLLIYLVIFALIVGCSGGGGEAPTSPDLTDSGTADQIRTNNTINWGLGEVVIDVEAGTAEVIPARTAEFTINLTKFYNPPNDVSKFTVTVNIDDCDFLNRIIDINLILQHPFPGTIFWGFDTRMTIFGAATTVGKHDSSVTFPAAEELRILNADGYMRWWNFLEFGPLDTLFGYTDGWISSPGFFTTFGTVNGYKYFYDGISSTEMPINPSASNRGKFIDNTVSRKTTIQFPDIATPYKFKYSIATSWQLPNPNPPSSAADFPLDANTPEAYNIVVTQDPVSSTGFFNPDTGEFGGNLVLDIEVFDWQADGNPEGEIAGLWIESQTLFPSAVEITSNLDWIPTVTGNNSVKFSGTITNVTPTAIEGQEIFVTVENTDPNTYEPVLPDFLFPDSPLAAYQLFTCTIKDSGTPVEKWILVENPNGGETAFIDQLYTILWTWDGAIINVDIDLSLDNGADGYAIPIASSTPCDGVFEWVPEAGTETTEALIRITESGVSPEAQDFSDDVFTIEVQTNPDQGWNPIPGQIGMPIDPAPNQSTYVPDLGIQNDGAGNEGAWYIDQEGGVPLSPIFSDYALDWSGPGGNAYESGFNYRPAPFARHDVDAQGVAINGIFGSTTQDSPPHINDPYTGFWYRSYLIADGTYLPGDLAIQIVGDWAEPPETDPDERPWAHFLDLDSGMPGTQGEIADDILAIGKWSTIEGAPEPESLGMPGQYDNGGLIIGLRQFPYDGSLWSWNFPDWTTDNTPAPVDQAFDVTDVMKCRLAADNDSYLTTGWVDPPEDLACPLYMIDAGGNFYATLFEMQYSEGSVWYLMWEGVYRLRPLFDPLDLYLDDCTMVDLAMIPTVTYLYEGDYLQGMNWLAIIYDDGAGGTILVVYHMDWTVEDIMSIVEIEDSIPGTPLAVDVDSVNFEIHVMTDNGGTIEATVYDYTP